MAACPKISRGVFSKNFRPGGSYTKNTPLPPLPANILWFDTNDLINMLILMPTHIQMPVLRHYFKLTYAIMNFHNLLLN